MRQFIGMVVMVVGLSGTAVSAQQPQIVHAELTSRPASKGLAGELEALKSTKATAWVGYSVPATRGFSARDNNGMTYLEGDRGSVVKSHEEEGKTPAQAMIFLRVAAGAVEKIRVENIERSIDAGGMRVVWLTDVGAEDSVTTLTTLAKQKDLKRLRDGAVFAISAHATPGATPALIGLGAAGSDLELREKAAFWLANQRGHDGFLAIRHWAREDADDAFREKLTFDLTLSKESEAIPELVRMAHNDSSVRVRKQAQFWMAQKGGKVVLGDLHEMAENDPEASLRKSAVFAISRLPQDEATTQLIQLAQTGKDPAVRKQAVFWLGQSKDPRALDYLTQLLQQ